VSNTSIGVRFPAYAARRATVRVDLRRPGALVPWLAAVVVGIVACAVRAVYLNRSFDIFIDEITYFRLAQSVANTLTVTLYGKPFFLHPPAFFVIEGAYLKLLRPPGPLIDQIYAVRYLNILFAGLSAATLTLMGQKVGGWSAGLVAAALFMLDPFIVRIDSLNMLDASAITWVLMGYAVLLWNMNTATAPIPRRRAAAAGVLFGVALLTKDMMAFLTLGPLLILFVARWSLPRRTSALVGGATCLTYLPYPLGVAVTGEWGPFAQQKFGGLKRFLGLLQSTGFHHHGAPSLLSTVVTQLDNFGTTYVIIAAGTVAVVILLLVGDKAHRLIATWTIGAYALLAYGVVLGTLEEQFFYYLVVPALLAVAVASALLLTSDVVTGCLHRVLLTVLAALGLLLVAWSGYRWVDTHLKPGDGYQHTLTFIERHVPPHKRLIAATDETGQFLLIDQGYASGPWGLWSSVAQLQAYHPAYLVVNPHQVQFDHATTGVALLRWVAHHGQLVYRFRGNSPASDDVLDVYRLRGATRSNAPDRRRRHPSMAAHVTATRASGAARHGGLSVVTGALETPLT